MTAKQKANQERFKKVIAEAKKIRVKNPKLTQAEAVKKAWAIIYNKKSNPVKIGAVKKTAKKSAPKNSNYHKDTKSHNVKISVMSGVKLSADEIKFLQYEAKQSAGYYYRPKIIFGQECVLKETKIGTPVKKFIVDSYDKAKYLSDELNKNKKYKKIKSVSVK
jgi:hypothetical protein